MVFFNYSTMQMAAKVVYYGPGLCGKTTNLQWIFEHTSTNSRGEMVSLATETDRTLFFDLLPIDVGSIAGFSTRIQLYTVPGQVFYNTTRKLVLKGVDGVVFVADSQRPMLQANIESFQNLEENLAEMGLSVDTIPVVLQYNKRDLPNICSPEELDQAINRLQWPAVEASAINGQGVFETLKTISKKTLVALKKRLMKGRSEAPAVSPAPRPAVRRPPLPAKKPAPAPAAAPTPAAVADRGLAESPPPAETAPVEPEVATPEPAAAQPDAAEKLELVELRDVGPPELLAAEPPQVEPRHAGQRDAGAPEPLPETLDVGPPQVEPQDAGPPAAEPPEPLLEVPPAETLDEMFLDVEPPDAGPSEPFPEVPPAEFLDVAALDVEPPDAGAPEPLAAPTLTEPPEPVAAASAAVEPSEPVIETPPAAPEPVAAATPVEPSTPAAPPPAAPARGRRRRAADFDALAELEKLRRETVRPKSAAAAKVTNGRGEINRDFRLTLKRSDFSRAQRFSLILQLEDGDRQIVDEARHLHVDIDNASSLERLLLRLNIDLNAST